MTGTGLRLFALEAAAGYGARVAAALGTRLAPHEERSFEDGEHKSRPLVGVRGTDCYLVGSLHGEPTMSANDKLVRTLFLAGALRDAGARSVTLVAPYLCYMRKDRRTQPRDPVSTRYLAELVEAVGVDRVVSMDVHNPAAFENAFRRPAELIEARWLLADALVPLLDPGCPVVVVSPDTGGAKRAERFRTALSARLGREAGFAFVEKWRAGGRVSGERLAGDVSDGVAVIVDDIIAAGTTVARSAEACRRAGARKVIAAATHGLFARGAEERLPAARLDGLVVTDSVPPVRLPARAAARVAVADSAPLVAEAIRRLHAGGSLSALNEGSTPLP